MSGPAAGSCPALPPVHERTEAFAPHGKPRKAEARSKAEAHVDFCREEDGKGFYFDLKAFVSVEDMELAEVEKLAQSAHKRCPVSKIIGDYNHVTIEVVPFTE